MRRMGSMAELDAEARAGKIGGRGPCCLLRMRWRCVGSARFSRTAMHCH